MQEVLLINSHREITQRHLKFLKCMIKHLYWFFLCNKFQKTALAGLSTISNSVYVFGVYIYSPLLQKLWCSCCKITVHCSLNSHLPPPQHMKKTKSKTGQLRHEHEMQQLLSDNPMSFRDHWVESLAPPFISGNKAGICQRMLLFPNKELWFIVCKQTRRRNSQL